jgi:hypothetical protein
VFVRHALGALIAALCAAAAAQAAPASPLAVRFEDRRVVATGVEPGGSAVLFGVSRVWEDLSTRLVETREIVADDDGDGSVALETRIVPGSIWVAVDLANGVWQTATPPGGELRDGSGFAPAIEVERSNGRRRLSFAGRALDLLVLRPGFGAWFAISRDGADEETGEPDGKVKIESAAFLALGESGEAPASFEAGDLLVGIDPETLRVLVRRGSQLPVEEVE